MALTPIEVCHTQFKAALRGYNKRQVDEFVRSVQESLDQAVTEKAELQRRVDMLQEDIDRVRKIESSMSSALTLAQKSADEIKTAAHQQAELILREAEHSRVKMVVDAQKETERLRSEIAILEDARERFECEFRASLQGYLDWLEKRKPTEEVRAEVA